jgi:hypothetical protein
MPSAVYGTSDYLTPTMKILRQSALQVFVGMVGPGAAQEDESDDDSADPDLSLRT